MKPLLSFDYNSSKKDKFMKLIMRNDGKGPAIIRNYSISNISNNFSFPRNRVFEQFARDSLGKNITPGATFFERGDVLKSESEYTLAVIDFSNADKITLAQVKQFILGLKVVVDYTDVYERNYDPAIKVFGKDI